MDRIEEIIWHLGSSGQRDLLESVKLSEKIYVFERMKAEKQIAIQKKKWYWRTSL